MKGFRAPRSSRVAVPAFPLILLLVLTQTTFQSAASQRQNRQQERQADGEQVTTLHSDLVVLNLTVTDDKGMYAHGLREEDFTIREDKVVQSPDSFAAEEAPFAAALLLDMSGSMGYKFGLARAAAASFLENIRDYDQVAVYGFHKDIRLFQEFSDSRIISDYIWDAHARDVTRLYDCVEEAVSVLEARPERRRAILLISDGHDTSSRTASFDSSLKKALSAGVTVYAVDLTDARSLGGTRTDAAAQAHRAHVELRQYAEQSGGRYVHSPQGDILEESFLKIVDELRNQYTITYYSSNEKRDGKWRSIAVDLSRPDLTVRARKGYYAPRR